MNLSSTGLLSVLSYYLAMIWGRHEKNIISGSDLFVQVRKKFHLSTVKNQMDPYVLV